jgi:hypothetical protein
MAVRVVLYEPGVILLQGRVDERVKERVLEPMAEDMRTYVPILTGDLLGTIRTDPYVGKGRHRIWIGDTAAGIDYHLYVEYGTSKMDAQPYIRPAVYRVRG